MVFTLFLDGVVLRGEVDGRWRGEFEDLRGEVAGRRRVFFLPLPLFVVLAIVVLGRPRRILFVLGCS